MNRIKWIIAKWCGIITIIENQQKQINNLKEQLMFEIMKGKK